MSLYSPGQINDTLNDGYVTGIVTVGVSQIEAKSGAQALNGRNVILIQNKSNNTVYFGPTGVTTTTGIPIRKNQFVSLTVSDNISIFLIAAEAGNDVIVQEIG